MSLFNQSYHCICFFQFANFKACQWLQSLQNSDSSKILNQTNLCSDDSMIVPNSGF